MQRRPAEPNHTPAPTILFSRTGPLRATRTIRNEYCAKGCLSLARTLGPIIKVKNDCEAKITSQWCLRAGLMPDWYLIVTKIEVTLRLPDPVAIRNGMAGPPQERAAMIRNKTHGAGLRDVFRACLRSFHGARCPAKAAPQTLPLRGNPSGKAAKDHKQALTTPAPTGQSRRGLAGRGRK
jgi:hypothetical protein